MSEKRIYFNNPQSPIFISPAPRVMSCKQVVSSCESEKYFSIMPAVDSVPVM